MEIKENISGISDNLSESITTQKETEKKSIPRGRLHGKRIAISVSMSENLEQLGLSKQHLQDISIEIARYLIVNGAKLLYGGDLRQGGFTELFSELSHQYRYLNDREKKFVNYFPFPNARLLSVNDKAMILQKQVELRILEIPGQFMKAGPGKEYNPAVNIEDRFLYAECFSDMRAKMTIDSHARIVLGGVLKNHIGYLPGIVEETYNSMKAGKAVYLLGGFGGATSSIIEALMGGKPQQLTNDFQYDTSFLIAFRDYCSGRSSALLDYDLLIRFFQHYSVEELAKQNGLSMEENQVLFKSTNIHELVLLLLKGLRNISDSL